MKSIYLSNVGTLFHTTHLNNRKIRPNKNIKAIIFQPHFITLRFPNRLNNKRLLSFAHIS